MATFPNRETLRVHRNVDTVIGRSITADALQAKREAIKAKHPKPVKV